MMMRLQKKTKDARKSTEHPRRARLAWAIARTKQGFILSIKQLKPFHREVRRVTQSKIKNRYNIHRRREVKPK
ncbi:hypothetical protein D8Y20_05770 [Mariprofundus sp. EBB-1]|nr:hypothetical protein D8Y20_05770 [Mariprofundus sp. EBB-1]